MIQINETGAFRGRPIPGRVGIRSKEARGDFPEVATLDGSLEVFEYYDAETKRWEKPSSPCQVYFSFELTRPQWGDDSKPNGLVDQDDELIQAVADILGWDFADLSYFEKEMPNIAVYSLFTESTNKTTGKKQIFCQRSYIYPYDTPGGQVVDKRVSGTFTMEKREEGLAAFRRIVGPGFKPKKAAAAPPAKPRPAPTPAPPKGFTKDDAWEAFCIARSHIENDADVEREWSEAINDVAGPIMTEEEMTSDMWHKVATYPVAQAAAVA